MRTPAASAMRTRLRRSPLTASRASRMLSQTGVPTSTTLLWSSGLIWSPRCAPAASISSMWLLSARVEGSTSWNSSSIPRVSRSVKAYQGSGGTHAASRWAFATPPATPLAERHAARAAQLYVSRACTPSHHWLDEERRHLPASRRDVRERSAREPCQEPLHLPLEHEGIEVHDQVAEAQVR